MTGSSPFQVASPGAHLDNGNLISTGVALMWMPVLSVLMVAQRRIVPGIPEGALT
jgi:ABC-type glycerol-3-phosphate transport system permease component